MEERIVVFSFDGVLMKPRGGSPPTRQPVPGMLDAVRQLFTEGWQIEICTSRALTRKGRDEVIHWLVVNGFIEYIACVTPSRHEADVHVDARAIAGLVDEIRNFPSSMDRRKVK